MKQRSSQKRPKRTVKVLVYFSQRGYSYGPAVLTAAVSIVITLFSSYTYNCKLHKLLEIVDVKSLLSFIHHSSYRYWKYVRSERENRGGIGDIKQKMNREMKLQLQKIKRKQKCLPDISLQFLRRKAANHLDKFLQLRSVSQCRIYMLSLIHI